MRRSRPQLAIMLVVAATTCAHAAAPNAPGVNLRWDQCYADGGAWNKNFACDTNAGSDRMVGSFELATAPAQPLTGFIAYLNVNSVADLPSWWHFKNFGTCRQNSLALATTPPAGAVNCVDWGNGQAVGGIGAYSITFGVPGVGAYIQVPTAVPLSELFTPQPGQEYFAFSLTFNHAKTVGTGSCSGCQTPVVIFLSAIRFWNQTGPDILVNQGANWTGSQYVSWQQGYPTNITRGCGSTGAFGFCEWPYVHFDTVPYDVTSARPTTWGALKALYR